MEIESTLIDQLDIFIHSASLPYLKEKEIRGIRCLRVFLDVDRECATYQEDSQTIIKAFSSIKEIKFEVGKRAVKKKIKGVHNWTRFLSGADKATTRFTISLGDKIISRGQISQIASELFKLNHLEQLELQFGSENNLGIGGMKQIGQSIKNMKQLKNLYIDIGDNCNLGEDGAKQLFQGIEDSQNLEKLKLIIGNSNQLNAEGTYAISSTIGKLNKIRDLEINIAKTNSLGVRGVKRIITDILQQKQMKKVIERLSLKIGDRRGVNIENIISLFQSLAEFTRLKDFSFDLGVKGEMKEQVIQIINDSLKQLKDLQSIQISICSDPYPFVVSPMVTLLTHFQLSNKIRNLTLLIPPQSEFNNSELTLFSVSLYKLTELQTFSLEIKENNILGLTPKRKLPSNIKKLSKTIIQEQQQQEGGKEKISSHFEIPEKEMNQSRRGISDISEALSTLKKLEKVEWIISEKNDVSDSGWEMLSRSSSLRELRVKIGEGCRFSEEGLHSLSKINSNISLECLHFELGQGNETTDRGWGSFMSSINPKKLQNFMLAIGLDNECSDKSLENFAVNLMNSVNLEYCTLNLQETISSNSNYFMRIAKSMQFCTQLKFLHILIPEDAFISGSTLSSLSNSLEKMSYLKDLRLEASIEDSVSLFGQMKLCSVICSIPNLVFLQLKLKGKLSTQISGFHNFTEKNENILKSDQLLQFRTQNGFHFIKSSIPISYPQQFIDEFAESLTLLPPDTTFLKLGLKQLNPPSSLHQIVNKLGAIKKCIVLKLNYGDNFLDEITMDELAQSISTMRFLTILSLKTNIEILSLSAAKALSGLLQSNERILKAKLTLKSSIKKSQTQAQFVLLSAIASCPNLRKVNIDFTFYYQIKLQIEQKVADPCLLSLMQDEEFQKQQPIIVGNYDQYRPQKLPLKTSLFSYVQSEEHPDNQDDQMLHLANFVNKSGILQKIEIKIASQMFISTQVAQILHEGIKKQVFLNVLQLKLNDKCRISGEGVTLITRALKLLKRVSYSFIVLQTDQSFSFFEALQVMLSMQKNENSKDQIRKDYLDIFGGKVLISTQQSSYLKQLIQMRPITDMYIYQEKGVESLKETTISQVLAQINQFQNLQFIEIDTSKLHQEEIDEWKALESLHSLTSLSINEKSPSYSSRFYSLNTALSKMVNLDILKLRLIHTDSNEYVNKQKVDDIPSFGQNLGALNKLTTLTLDLTNFVFGQHGAKELSEGILKMIKLQVIKLICVENSDLSLKDIKLLCQSATISASIIQSQLQFKVTETTSESDIFNILNKQKINMMGLNKESFIKINRNINQTIGVLISSQHEKSTDSVYFNSNHFYHSYQLPKDYKIGSIYEKEARQSCMKLFQLQFNNQKEILRSITAKCNTLNIEIEDSILIFLQTLFLFLKQEDQHLSKLIIIVNLNQNSQFELITEEALKHLVRVDTLEIYFSVPFQYRNIFNELRQISKIQNITNLNINITQIKSIDLQLLRIVLLRKLKRLVVLQINTTQK